MGCKAGLIVSGPVDVFLYILVSVSPCLQLWLPVSGSPDFSLHLSPFICFPLWLVASPILASVVWLHGCLSFCVFLHVSPTLASGVPLSGCLFFSLGSHSYVSPSGDVLFLFHHGVIFDWSSSLFFTPFVSSCCLRSYTSIDSR